MPNPKMAGSVMGEAMHRAVVPGGLAVAVETSATTGNYPIRERIRGIEGCLSQVEQRLASLRRSVTASFPEKDLPTTIANDHVLDSLTACERLTEQVFDHLLVLEEAI